MIPSLVVEEIRSALVEYLSTTYALSDDAAQQALTEFLGDPVDGIFRGPYAQVRTPFASVGDSWQPPLDWVPEGFRPYAHQASAFERLSTVDGRTPQPTIVTTGTGSGKTECFLYPILDHCARERAAGRQGIKALILYPMNALASDQAGRLAELVHSEAALAGITAGLYVGEQGRHSDMGPGHLIDKREVMRVHPPDILLTNYKMLDFLLLRKNDRELWAGNLPDTLRYVVLDELHTYDGAQGTDVAMLLRRLGRTLAMSRPGSPLGDACPVATSATLGTGVGAAEELRGFAGKVFGTPFDDGSVIGETRLSVEDTCGPVNYFLPIPDPIEVAALDSDDTDAIAAAFCAAPDDGIDPTGPDDVVELGRRLLAHPLTRAVLAAVSDRPRAWSDAVAEVITRAPEWGRAYMRRPDAVENALGKYLHLLSIARRERSGEQYPLLTVEIQLWIREVSRVLRSVEDQPRFRWRDSAATIEGELGPDQVDQELPAVYCRRCGSAGWMALASEVSGRLTVKPETIYAAALARNPNQRALIHAHPDLPEVAWYDPVNRELVDAADDGLVPVLVTPSDEEARRSECPACGESDGIRFLGTKVASLASVALSTYFGSPSVELEERKLLAFTDSVQDASHRAAFFSGRTYRFNLRSLLSGAAMDAGSTTLADLAATIADNATTPIERYAVVSPDLLRHREVRTVWTDRPDGGGLELLRQRIAFEAHLEFGLRSRIGRTLELSGAASAHVEIRDFDAIVDLIGEDFEAQFGQVDSATLDAIPVWLRGLVERARLRGGIHHPFLDPYIADNGRTWHIWGGRPDGMPPFVRGISRPTFATTALKGDFDSLTTVGKTPTWFVDWAVRTLGVEPHDAGIINPRVFSLLANETDAVQAHQVGANKVYSLNAASIAVTDVGDDGPLPQPSLLSCDICGHRHVTAPDRINHWVGTPCLRYRCPGRFRVVAPKPANYYRRLYRTGQPRRVVTGEHTGLLDRRSREDLETAFKTGTAADSPNVITATPTLEMGIDIGDLSAVMLTSVPPKPANYIQRAGRAGRRTGNALITTFARSDTHDLYYLTDPDAMLAGDVRPPNCYLDAAETLQRQYVAYLIDRVADQTINAPALEQHMGKLIPGGFDDDGFFRHLIDASTLDPTHIDAFVTLFGDQLSGETVEQLREFATGGIAVMLKDAAETWNASYRDLGLRRDRIRAAIERLSEADQRNPNTEEDLKDLKGQRASIINRLQDARKEYSLSGLERLGVLPNYTLIDDAATLEATMWSRDDDGNYEVERYEYGRPAALAVREFAPGNSFYAGGHRHVIDTLDIGSADEPHTETWRLCPDCGFGEIERNDQPRSKCPRCGLEGITDVGTRHKMLRLQTARSNSSEETARVYDESDDRQRENYDVITSVDVDPANVTGAWQLTGRVFGAEFGRYTKIHTINLGLKERQGESIPIDGAPRHVTRFAVCAHCGAARDGRDDRGGKRPEALHHGWCKVRSGAVRERWEQILLHHELTTDAIRLLLPVSMFDIDTRLASFKGALLLGLRKDFGGDPDHLHVITSELPNRAGLGRYHFLVLYDRVPGGTGYLDRLADPDRVREILEGARELIARCQCVNEGRHACHRCLLGVVDRSEYDLVSRDLALSLLDELLTEWEVDDTIATIADVPIAKVEESELERRFKVALQDWAATDPLVTMKPIPGKNGYGAFELRFADDDRQLVARYRIDEQEGLGTSPSTIPDYTIRRVDSPGRDIAVYLDGYQFHASDEHNNISADAAKRNGIRSEGKWVWNLTWNDVEEFHTAVTAEMPRRPPNRPLLTGKAKINAKAIHAGRPSGTAEHLDYDTVDDNPLQLLLVHLRHPDPETWSRLARSAVAGMASVGGLRPVAAANARQVIEAALRNETLDASVGPAGDRAAPALANVAQWTTSSGLKFTPMLAMANPNAEAWTVFSVLADSAEDLAAGPADKSHIQRWREWLQWANVIQFLGARHEQRAAWIAGVSDPDMAEIDDLWIMPAAAVSGAPTAQAPAAETTVEITDDMIEELDLVLDRAARALAKTALHRGAPPFIAGYELDGTPIEVAWPEQRIGVLASGDGASTADDTTGWRLETADRWTTDQLLEALKGDR